MNPSAVCTLIVRVIGLVLILWRAEVMSEYLVSWTGWALTAFSFKPYDLWGVFWIDASRSNYFLPDVVILGQFALGLYMLLSGKRVVRLLLRRLPGVDGLCPRCGYEISGLQGGRCPECGAKLPERP